MSFWQRLFGWDPEPTPPPGVPVDPVVPDPGLLRLFGEAGGPVPISVFELGTLEAPTGRIIACDPFVTFDTGPFAHTVAPGAYRVALAIARVSPDDERVAAALLEIRPGIPIVGWELARLAAHDSFGYAVDAGMGCFMDAQAAQAFAAAGNDPAVDPDLYANELLERLDRSRNTVTWLLHVPPESGGGNVAMFSSGWGDGVYDTYVGIAADGSVVCFVTDFGVLPGP